MCEVFVKLSLLGASRRELLGSRMENSPLSFPRLLGTFCARLLFLLRFLVVVSWYEHSKKSSSFPPNSFAWVLRFLVVHLHLLVGTWTALVLDADFSSCVLKHLF